MMKNRSSERGSAMLVTMIIMAALLAGGAVLIGLQLSANKSTDLTRTGISATYCAEAGLAATKIAIAAQRSDWGAWLGTGNEPSWLSAISHDVDGDSVADWKVTLEDNFDEAGTDVPGTDSDSKIFVVSRCSLGKFSDTPREIRELIDYTALKNCYNAQKGGCGGNANMN